MSPHSPTPKLGNLGQKPMCGIENCPNTWGRGRDLLLQCPNFHPAVSYLEQTLMEQCILMQNQPLLKTT